MARFADPTPPRHPLTYVRMVRGWSLQDLANLLGTRNPQTIWRWERWDVTPDSHAQRALAAELDVSLERLRVAPWPAWLPVGEGINLEMDWTADSCHSLLDATVDASVLDRRGFMTLAAGAAEVLIERWQSTIQATLERTDGVGPDLIGSLQQRLPLLRDMEDTIGGVPVGTTPARRRRRPALHAPGPRRHRGRAHRGPRLRPPRASPADRPPYSRALRPGHKRNRATSLTTPVIDAHVRLDTHSTLAIWTYWASPSIDRPTRTITASPYTPAALLADLAENLAHGTGLRKHTPVKVKPTVHLTTTLTALLPTAAAAQPSQSR